MDSADKIMKSSKWPRKNVQTRSQLNRSRGHMEKSWSPSDSSWFETKCNVKLLFLEPIWIMKTLGWRRKKSLAGGPPDFARRGPLGRRGRRVLRTIPGSGAMIEKPTKMLELFRTGWTARSPGGDNRITLRMKAISTSHLGALSLPWEWGAKHSPLSFRIERFCCICVSSVNDTKKWKIMKNNVSWNRKIRLQGDTLYLFWSFQMFLNWSCIIFRWKIMKSAKITPKGGPRQVPPQ